MEATLVVVMVSYRTRPGKEEIALRELAGLVGTVLREESSCMGIEMLQDAADPTRIVLNERWASRSAYLGPHMQTPHIREFIQKASDYLAGPPEITFWRSVVSE